jgi:potassium-dependent mechanosensitive channel
VKRAFRFLMLGMIWASIWPAFLVLLAQATRLGPWPRSLGILASTVFHGLAIGVLVQGFLAWLMGPESWAERYLGIPGPVGHLLSGAGRFLAAAAVVLLVPAYLLTSGEIAPDGRPIIATAMSRFFILGFEVIVWATCLWLLHRGSALMDWFGFEPSVAPAPRTASNADSPSAAPADDAFGPASASPDGARGNDWLVWLSKRRRPLAWMFLATVAAIIVLDVRGFSFTARRLALGGSETLAVIALSWALHRLLIRIIPRYAWHWVRPTRSWARALTNAVALRTSSRVRGSNSGDTTAERLEGDDDSSQPEDLAGRLQQLTSYTVGFFCALALAWVWELDLALVRFLASQPVCYLADQTPVTLGDLTKSAIVILAGALAWRYISTLFALTLFPRIPDDPGVRFAIVTLCRYAVLGLTAIFALGAIHLGMAQIGVVLAALGVGLGFGLQEIVSNFVCGIILLLERPIRIGDVVTVAGTTGQVDRINIRATRIINGDNQSMIVPNRQFITGNLVNWTHNDKVLRVSIKIGVAYGSDPDQVVDLLLGIAKNDPDVLPKPMPAALLEDFGEMALRFVLYVYVPEPGVVGLVRHRLCTAIRRQFEEANIGLPYPTHAVHLCRVPDDLTRVLEQPRGSSELGTGRIDQGSMIPPPPHGADVVVPAPRYQPLVDPEEGRSERCG